MTDSPTPDFREEHLSKVPALQLLQNLGYDYLLPEEVLELRGGRLSGVILDGILMEQLRRNNRIRYKGGIHEFSDANIRDAVQALKDVYYDGLVRTSENVYDILCLGKNLPQTIEGDTKSFPVRYIDWNNPRSNVYHLAEEFAVDRRRGQRETTRPDIVLFVNGIPLAVIECKRKGLIEQGITQQIRNQRDEYIPQLYIYAQLLLSVAVDEAKYATTGTAAPFWAVWKEEEDGKEQLHELVNQPLSPPRKSRLFRNRTRQVRDYFDALEAGPDRQVTEQDRALYALCRPERLLELARRYIVFETGEKKIARYQQYFCVRKVMDRVQKRDAHGRREGGLVWHTQGSGKSLTMVMLANVLALDDRMESSRIVLVTDRVDLDDQIWNTFRRAGLDPQRARTGKHLVQLLRERKARIITTVIDKFETASGSRGVRDESPDIFVFVDEGHRGQYGPLHERMRRTLPNACFIGFTGTPVMKKEKHTIERFGGLIDDYTLRRAVEDKAVVPLLYEGRHVNQKVDSDSIDAWFDRITSRLNPAQTADLKRKFSTTQQLNKAQQKVMRIAWDISEHFHDNWRGTPFKGQLVAQDKSTAILYKRFLDEFGIVTSEVLISAPDDREGDEDVQEENRSEVVAFWRKMMERFGNEATYNREMISAFKQRDTPEIIIVVDKLLTGFDAPRNIVLYLTRKLTDHSLLQAIARVNRLYEGKEFGYILDYRGVLAELDSALDLYESLSAYDRKELGVVFSHAADEVAKLPQRYSELWDVFKTILNRRDIEAYEQLLGDEGVRKRFYERLSSFARTLAIALSTQAFIDTTPREKVEKYRSDLKFFMSLRSSVRRRYAELVDFKEYEGKIQKLLDVHVGTGEVEQITELVDIFDKSAFAREVEKLGSDASRADTIAFRTLRMVNERIGEDPAFYTKFSKMLEKAIQDFREQRLSAVDYLKKVRQYSEQVRDRTDESIPVPVQYNTTARAYYGIVRERLVPFGVRDSDVADIGADAALAIDRIIDERRIVHWKQNVDVQNQMRNEIEDYLFELKDRSGLPLTVADIDHIMEQCLSVARVRKP